MRKNLVSGFDLHLAKMLREKPKFAKAYAMELASHPLTVQLGIMRRRQWLSQQDLARKLRVKQPHVARTERASHNPRLSSLCAQARALNCRIMLVPEKLVAKVAGIVSSGGRAF